MVRPWFMVVNAFRKARYIFAVLLVLALVNAGSVGAFNYVADANGT